MGKQFMLGKENEGGLHTSGFRIRFPDQEFRSENLKAGHKHSVSELNILYKRRVVFQNLHSRNLIRKLYM